MPGNGREKEKEKKRETVKGRESVTMIGKGRERESETGKKNASEKEKKGRERENGNGKEREKGNEKEQGKGIKNENVSEIGKKKTRDGMTAEKSEKICEKIETQEMDMTRENPRSATEMKGVPALGSHLSAGANILLTVTPTTVAMIKMKNTGS